MFVEKDFIEHDICVLYAMLVFSAVYVLLCLPLCINTLFGKTRFILGDNKFKSTYTCLFLKSKGQIDLIEIHQFKKDFHNLFRIWVDCYEKEKSTGFITPASEKEVDALCDILNTFLQILKEKEQ
jgi:hypothetical protein